MRVSSIVRSVNDSLSAEDVLEITRISLNRWTGLLQANIVRASVVASKGRGHHNRFSLVDALVGRIYSNLIDMHVSAKRMHAAIGAELYTKLEHLSTSWMMPYSLLVVSPGDNGEPWRCDLVAFGSNQGQEPVSSGAQILPPGVPLSEAWKWGPVLRLPAFTSIESGVYVLPVGAIWVALQEALEARIAANTATKSVTV
jgi:hypothetical protein